MPRGVRSSPVKATIQSYDLSILSKRGNISWEKKATAIYNANKGNPAFQDGLIDYADQLSSITGTHISPKQAFLETIKHQLSDPNHLKPGELKQAVGVALYNGPLREARRVEGSWNYFAQLTGKKDQSKRWRQFRKETGFTGTADDYLNMERQYTTSANPKQRSTQIIYTNPDGTKWVLDIYYDQAQGGMTTDWYEL